MCPNSFKEKIDKRDEVSKASAFFLFEHMLLVRMLDAKRNALVYLSYADKLIEGNPKNIVTAVPVPGGATDSGEVRFIRRIGL